ncbi:TolC family protein [bacterium]|nr:TolC family protein [bacterium]
MKKLLSALLTLNVLVFYNGLAFAAAPNPNMPRPQQKVIQPAPNAKTIELAFVFDGPSDKNTEVLKVFQQTITRSLLPEFKASFPKDLIFSGDWTQKGAIDASNKALASRANMVISLGYMSSDYYSDKQNKNKYVITIDQYGLRDFGNKFFNPIQQATADFATFKRLCPEMKKVAILMNSSYYALDSNWDATIARKLKEKGCDVNFTVVPVDKNVKASLAKMSADVDGVFVTPLFNLDMAGRKELYGYINEKKLPSFSSVGKEDVALGAMLGASTFDVDKKLAEATSFNIYGVLHGQKVKNEKLPFYDDKVIFYNADSADVVGYTPPLRLLNNAVTISTKEKPKFDLGLLIDTLDKNNLDIKRKQYLIDAARRSVYSAYMRYLPTLRIDLGYQTYNKDYATSYSNVPTRVGQFTLAMDQVIYSPDLVTNIIVKHKKLKFDKAEEVLTRATTELNVATLYIQTLMLENMLKVQREVLQETRENLAIARVREKTGKCGNEEVMRWAGEVSEQEKHLLNMEADYKNVKIHINKLLFRDQKEDFCFAPLTAGDPAFFTSDLHVIDHVRDPKKLEKFTQMLIQEVTYLSPETTKLKAAIAMKKAEISNYGQKFFMPNAKLSLEYGSQFDRHLPYEEEGHNQLRSGKASLTSAMGGSPADVMNAFYGSPYLGLDKTYARFMVAAQWKPIEGGHKIAEIARCKAELNELNAYLEEVNTEIEMNIREVVNRAIAKYFMIEKSYKAMFAQAENYHTVKARYLVGKSPINQISDAQHLYFKSKVEALNSQYEFFKELIWVQRGLLSVNWQNALPEAKAWINNIPNVLPAEDDFAL